MTRRIAAVPFRDRGSLVLKEGDYPVLETEVHLDSVRIDGRIKGEIKVAQTVIIGEAANVQATIDADTAIVSGEVKGDIIARKKITLDKNARVTGNLSTPGIVIEEGACLRGQIVIGADEDEIARPAKSDKASAPTGGGRRRGVVTPTPAPQL